MTVEVIRKESYKYAKYKKLKNDISDFIQNKVKQKLNLRNQEEYQTVVDKK